MLREGGGGWRWLRQASGPSFHRMMAVVVLGFLARIEPWISRQEKKNRFLHLLFGGRTGGSSGFYEKKKNGAAILHPVCSQWTAVV